MISSHLREEIRLKEEKIGKKPEFYDQRNNLVRENLRTIGDTYSFWIENPELRKAILLENKQIKTIKKQAEKGIQAIHNAWYFLAHKGEYGRFIEILDSEIVKGTNGLVNGGDKDSGKFRTSEVTLNIPGFTPISHKHIFGEVKLILEVVKLKRTTDPIEAAIYTHLALALTQPFEAGNKRTARLLQDRLLYDAGFPPAVITAGEAKFYLGLLGKTALAYREKSEEGMKQFFDYVASKVNNGLDDILNDLNGT